MILCRVLGSTVATRKDAKLEGTKLLVVAETDPDGAEREELHVAADAIGAGAGDLGAGDHRLGGAADGGDAGAAAGRAGRRDRGHGRARRRAGLRRGGAA